MAGVGREGEKYPARKKCHKLVLTKIQHFFFFKNKYSLDGYKHLVNFQNSEKVDSNALFLVFSLL